MSCSGRGAAARRPTVDDDHLMPDVVAEIGPGGHFLKAKHTRQHLRSGDLSMPQLMLKRPYDAWRIAKRGEFERAIAAVAEILAGHRPKPLPAGAADRIDGVIAAAGASSAGGSGLIGEAVLSGPRPEGPRRGPD